MNRLSLTVIAVFACMLLLLTAEPVFADCGCGGPRRPPTTHSSLSGLGVGLAGVALAWGVMWIGIRLVGRINRK